MDGSNIMGYNGVGYAKEVFKKRARLGGIGVMCIDLCGWVRLLFYE